MPGEGVHDCPHMTRKLKLREGRQLARSLTAQKRRGEDSSSGPCDLDPPTPASLPSLHLEPREPHGARGGSLGWESQS